MCLFLSLFSHSQIENDVYVFLSLCFHIKFLSLSLLCHTHCQIMINACLCTYSLKHIEWCTSFSPLMSYTLSIYVHRCPLWHLTQSQWMVCNWFFLYNILRGISKRCVIGSTSILSFIESVNVMWLVLSLSYPPLSQWCVICIYSILRVLSQWCVIASTSLAEQSLNHPTLPFTLSYRLL